MKNVRNVEEKTLSDELKSTILVNELKAETIKWREKNTHTTTAQANETNARAVRRNNGHNNHEWDNELSGNLFPFGHTHQKPIRQQYRYSYASVCVCVFVCSVYVSCMRDWHCYYDHCCCCCSPLFIIFKSFKNKTGAIQIYQRKHKMTWNEKC